MKTLKEIHSEANKYSESEPLQDAFVAGARWALTGKYYKPSELFNNNAEVETVDLEVEESSAIIQTEPAPTFEEFWEAYSYKKGRKKAEEKWNRLKLADKLACMAAVPAYVASTRKPTDPIVPHANIPFRMHPLTYLNGERWEDEIETPVNYEQQRNIQHSERAARLIASAYHQG